MRKFILKRSWRERLLVLVLLAVVAGLWLSSFLGRFSTWSARRESVANEADRQEMWRSQAGEIEARLANGLAQVQGGRSMGSAQFAGALDALVRKHRFSFRLDAPSTERRPPVAIHTITLSLEKAEIGAIVAMVTELRSSMPLVNIEQLTLSADRRNPAQLDARLRLSALEILP
jgi:hypothetical protein